MQISVIGTGYVGLVTGACFAEFGVNVVCMDNDEKRIARLEKGDVPFYEPGITELVTKGIGHGRLSFTRTLRGRLTTGRSSSSPSERRLGKTARRTSPLSKKLGAGLPARWLPTR